MNSNLRRWIALVVVCFGQLMIVLDATIVNVALPSIQRDLHFTQANLTWVVNSYLIAYGSLLLVAGRLGDLIGRRKVFLAGVLLFTAASVASGFSHGAAELVAGRFLQGLGGSLSAGVIIAIIVTGFQKPAERAQAMSIFTLVIAAGGSIGLLAGGFLTEAANWHWIFFVNAPIGLVTLLLGARLIDENQGPGLRQGVDIVGAALVTVALMLGVYGIVTASEEGWASVHTLAFDGLALLLLAMFVVLESRLRNPIMPLRVLAIRSLTGASAARALFFAGLFTSFFVGALYLQHIRGYNPFETGLAFLPNTLMVGVLSTGIAARLMRRIGPRNLALVGMATGIAALAILSTVDGQTSYLPWILSGYLLLGASAGTSLLPLLTIAMSEVPARDAGLASGFSNVLMQVGGALGLAAVGAISTGRSQALVAQGDPLPAALTGGYQLAFVLAAVSLALGLSIVFAVLRRGPAPIDLEQPNSQAEAA